MHGCGRGTERGSTRRGKVDGYGSRWVYNEQGAVRATDAVRDRKKQSCRAELKAQTKPVDSRQEEKPSERPEMNGGRDV